MNKYNLSLIILYYKKYYLFNKKIIFLNIIILKINYILLFKEIYF